MRTKPQPHSGGEDVFFPPQPLAAGRPYFILSAIPLAAGLVGVAPPLAAWIVGAAIAGLGTVRMVWARRERAMLRGLADEQLVAGRLLDSSPLLIWRATELVSRHNRRVLARSLNRIVGELEGRLLPGASPINRRAVRPHLDLVRRLVEKVGKVEEPVSARGMVRVQRLLCDSDGPLYERERSMNGVGPALERCLSSLEPWGDHAPAPRTSVAVSRHGRLVEAHARPRVARQRARH